MIPDYSGEFLIIEYDPRLPAPGKRKRSGITPDSCGTPGDPHNLEGGALASRNSCTLLFHLYGISTSAAPHTLMLAGTSLPMRLAAAPRMLLER
jgi:hypothetical protein